ncbi:hypothetical protein OH687_14940 [Burkholderia anthina]|nr:hypothetical protein OH687_14940 [Burkholderia anthina]
MLACRRIPSWFKRDALLVDFADEEPADSVRLPIQRFIPS